MKTKFKFGKYLIEYRDNHHGMLKFVKQKINSIDEAMRIADDLKNKQFSDVLIRINEKGTAL